MPEPIQSPQVGQPPAMAGQTTPPQAGALDEWEEHGSEPKFSGLHGDSIEDAKKKGFDPLKPNVYELFVLDVKQTRKPGYQTSEIKDYIELVFTVTKTIDGSPIQDMAGATFEAGRRRVWDTLDMGSPGFKNNNTEPSKLRAAVCALTGQDPFKNFKLDSLEELRGKSCRVLLDLKKGTDGVIRNKVSKYVTS